MPKFVKKRDGSVEKFDRTKIQAAVKKAAGDAHWELPLSQFTRRVLNRMPNDEVEDVILGVDYVHSQVENTLMDMKLYDIARSYITYRNEHKPDIFRKRTNIKPYEYPEFIRYVDAIRHAYWIHSEFRYEPDVQDVRVNLNDAERETVIRSMLAISHIEAKVKTFWAKVGDHLPKPEIAKVGVTFGDSEARHEDAYSHAIELLGLNDRFKTIEDVPAIRKRSNYLEKVNSNSHATDPRDYFESIILFSMFVENVSLFSQFYVIMAFNKEKSYLKGISNAVQATSKEEVLHAQFGFDLVNTIKRENPTWWSQDLRDYIVDITREAFEAEKEIIDWIYEEGDNEVCPKATNIELVKQRLNDSLVAIGIDPIFEIDPTLKKQTEWFDVEVMGTTEVDFFNKRSVAYTRYNKSVQAEDLF